ncbi:OLC1v1020830C1 [Oldenlandia corymbosa var. corymbosa]|uniref:OLC1v1020830C1 n=1 Tax=Oldenlandia corymbosa var. corymbosa TaxID=529605 RepID=A0AAV1BUC2_OLDCO|nr:OLC1v1020830C1 [Oldenlandia corymbosa var. corymbosa]
MGGVLCCRTQPITDENQPNKKNEDVPHKSSSSSIAAADYKPKKWMTLEECLMASPNINVHHHSCILGGGGHHDQAQMFRKNLPNKIHPSSSPDDDDINIEEFFTPSRSFSLGRIDEREEEEEQDEKSSASVTPSSRVGSGKSGRKVSFRLPGEADIFIYHTPKETLDEEP